VSAHPNHQSLYHGSRVFLKDLMRRHSGWEPPIKFYTLTTTNVLRKYLSILDAPASILSIILSRKEVGANPAPLLFVSGAADCWTAQTTMTRAHKSQMKWFRWGWIVMSRYMVINVLRKEKVV
jgi:N-acetylglucosaminylphosphatidylinositol deacetylase